MGGAGNGGDPLHPVKWPNDPEGEMVRINDSRPVPDGGEFGRAEDAE